MYQTIIYEGKEVKVLTAKQAAVRLGCGLSTIRKYLKNGLLDGTLVYDEKINRERQWIFFSSILSFTPPPIGRGKGNRDKTTDRSRRKKAARENGRLGGIAGRGGTKNRPRKINKENNS